MAVGSADQPAPSSYAGPLMPADEAAALSTGPINLSTAPFSQLSSQLFLSHLSSIPQSKTLILDPSLAGPLGLVVDTSSLKSVGVERMFWMEEKDGQYIDQEQAKKGKNVNAPTKAVVYVCRPVEKWLQVIKAHINYDVSNAADAGPLAHTYHALLTPHRTELSLLSLTSVLPHLDILDFGIELVPLEPDLLSLEEEGAAWQDLYIAGDQTVLHRSAMALMTCQMLWGCFPKIAGKGDLSKRLADLLLRQRREHLASDPTNPSLNSLSSVVDGLVIVERATDLATPMCSQLTYMGLVDEVVGVKSAHVEVDPSLLSGTPSQGSSSTGAGPSTPLVTPTPSRQLKKHRLDPIADPLYSQIRDLNFSTVGSVLHSFAKKLSTSYDDRHSAKTVSQMRAFVGKLGGLQSEHTALRFHTGLTEKLMAETNSETFNRSLEIQQNIVAGIDLNGQLNAIEDLILLEASLSTVLRLLCLYSVTTGGIKIKPLESFKRDICQVYGYQHLTTLLHLERVGLLLKSAPTPTGASGVLASAVGATASVAAGAVTSSGSGSSPFERVRQPLRLINDEVSESDPTDVAYVYSGYAPLSVRIVQAVGQKEALVGTGTAAAKGINNAANGSSSQAKPRAHPLVGWKGFEDVLAALPGETFDFAQSVTSNNGATNEASSSKDSSQTANAPWSSDPDRPRTTIVFYLGGITYAEVSALRFMGKRSRNRRWLIVTTGIIHGGKMIEACQPASSSSVKT